MISPSRFRRRGYWIRRALSRALSARTSETASSLGTQAADTRHRWGIAVDLTRASLAQLLLGVALFVVAEVLSRLLVQTELPLLQWVGSGPEDDGYRDLLAAGVGSLGALLGLYYATVGVVASTVYASVPAAIRGLFVEEPSGVVYVRGVVRAAMVGTAALTMGALWMPPAKLSLLLFAVLSSVALLRLTVLGGRIFNFFDPSSLADTLSRRVKSAMSVATSRRAQQRPAVQRTARLRAHGALTSYRDLAVLVEDRKGRSPEGSQVLTRELLVIALAYSRVKDRIATQSDWWDRKPAHKNWMTLDHTSLSVGLATATGVAPDLKPDHLWFEYSVSGVLRQTLFASYRAGGTTAVLGLADRIRRMTGEMSARFQFDEALLLRETWSELMQAITTDVHSKENPTTLSSNRLFAAEQLAITATYYWLGLLQGAQRLSQFDVDKEFQRALAKESSAYTHHLPVATLSSLEEFLDRAKREMAAEGRVVSPNWWRRHFVARSIAEQIIQGLERFKTNVDASIEPKIGELSAAGHNEIAASFAIAGIELLHKVEVHTPTFLRLLSGLAERQASALPDAPWPKMPELIEWSRGVRAGLYRQLADCMPELRSPAHDALRPDLYGQAYQFIFDEAFDAIIDGRKDEALALFNAVVRETDAARLRVGRDLADRDPRTQILFAVEPPIGLMELSGYARVMQELDEDGIWSEVEEWWESFLDATGASAVADFFVSTVSAHDSIWGISPGSLQRGNRAQRFVQLLRDRGLGGRDEFGIGRGPAGSRHSSPIVNLFAASRAMRPELAELFIATYLRDKLPPDTELPRGARSILDGLERDAKREARRTGRGGDRGADKGATPPAGDEEGADGSMG